MRKKRSGSRQDSAPRSGKRSRRRRQRQDQAAGTAGQGSRPLQFTRLNWLLLAAAAVILIFGYVALSSDSPVASTVAAPLLLVVGYGVLIPLGLIL